MARTCIDCGKSVSFFGSVDGRCQECQLAHIRERSTGETSAEHEEKKKARHKVEQAVLDVVLTTEAVAPFPILERLDIVTAECAFGMNIFRDLFASVRDITGGRSEAVQKTMRDTRKVALDELRREAHALGANAVIGVSLSYTELSGAGNMVLLVASGTAVKAEC
ncbi:YbjQ family protein [Thioclava sp. F28-4]|uniref:YbjQ family protein n=1 Tax=Thioclava sp. F28-4 TaxID=1915315 RepID=UPI000997172C|nr:YbjQ family protein [Thioclava sp. F28-4]OOY04460.1 hypothetical protein BMI87_13045 [Thioclava sp. F28-4]